MTKAGAHKDEEKEKIKRAWRNLPISSENPLDWLMSSLPLASDMTLKEARGLEPGCVDRQPLNRVTVHVRTWLNSEQTEKTERKH